MCLSTQTKMMQYRKFGRTDWRVSEIECSYQNKIFISHYGSNF